ncbi:pca operon transcription factor PcaQ [Devosia yakushimensis]|uniref:Pca operon transcription factor PcaQ n=1 Tax=Devosia yakushimensis TaxID=470028 RepID=A0ABQ5UEI5_9HYPH|nr:LysR family transcriptional regulator [Devosia yakushimensis]GLQ10500.1 pca operon transcription factor PcaQ [Devosia yakushimensis]
MDKLLRQFIAIAETGSIRAATAVLNITQPTLTVNMRKLEGDLNARLFVRSARGVRLTPYGEVIYENARLMQRLDDNMRKSVDEMRVRSERGISIGSGYSWWTIFVRDMLLRYQQQNPKAPVQVSLGDQLRCLDQLLSGDISLFVSHEIRGLSGGIGAQFIRLSQVYNGVFVRAGHPLLGAVRTPAEIEAYPVVTSSLAESRQQRFFDENWRRLRGEAPFGRESYIFGSNSISACLDYLRSTDAFLRISNVIAPYFAEQGVMEVQQAGTPAMIPMGIYVLAERRGEKRLENVLEWLIAACRETLPPPRD